VQTGVDHLETVVAKSPSDGLGPAIVPIEPGLGNHDAVLALHEPATLFVRVARQPTDGRPNGGDEQNSSRDRCTSGDRALSVARRGTLFDVRVPELRSPLARAVVPVLAGALVLALIGLFTWVMAIWISSNDTGTSERLAPSTFTIGNVRTLSETVADHGPLFFPELGTAIGTRSIVVDHTGEVAADNWRVYWAYPADRDETCTVEQIVETRTFRDCEGRIIDVGALAPPDLGVFPRVDDRTTLVIDLRGASSTSSASATPAPTAAAP
jgi:hypothetical protein